MSSKFICIILCSIRLIACWCADAPKAREEIPKKASTPGTAATIRDEDSCQRVSAIDPPTALQIDSRARELHSRSATATSAGLHTTVPSGSHGSTQCETTLPSQQDPPNRDITPLSARAVSCTALGISNTQRIPSSVQETSCLAVPDPGRSREGLGKASRGSACSGSRVILDSDLNAKRICTVIEASADKTSLGSLPGSEADAVPESGLQPGKEDEQIQNHQVRMDLTDWQPSAPPSAQEASLLRLQSNSSPLQTFALQKECTRNLAWTGMPWAVTPDASAMAVGPQGPHISLSDTGMNNAAAVWLLHQQYGMLNPIQPGILLSDPSAASAEKPLATNSTAGLYLPGAKK